MKKSHLIVSFFTILVLFSCKKEESVNSNPPVENLNGNIIFYIPEDYGVGKIFVSCNGISDTIDNFSKNSIYCDGGVKNFAKYNLPAGEYEMIAFSELPIPSTNSKIYWRKKFSINKSECKNMPLNYEQAKDTKKGSTGDLRFHLSWSENSKVDLNLIVTTPDGSEIYWYEREGQGGVMDVFSDCIVFPQFQENVFFPANAPEGEYKIKVVYSNYCESIIPNSVDFTLTVYNGLTPIKVWKGTNTSSNSSAMFEYNN